jgi:hypothetical protein
MADQSYAFLGGQSGDRLSPIYARIVYQKRAPFLFGFNNLNFQKDSNADPGPQI